MYYVSVSYDIFPEDLADYRRQDLGLSDDLLLSAIVAEKSSQLPAHVGSEGFGSVCFWTSLRLAVLGPRWRLLLVA